MEWHFIRENPICKNTIWRSWMWTLHRIPKLCALLLWNYTNSKLWVKHAFINYTSNYHFPMKVIEHFLNLTRMDNVVMVEYLYNMTTIDVIVNWMKPTHFIVQNSLLHTPTCMSYPHPLSSFPIPIFIPNLHAQTLCEPFKPIAVCVKAHNLEK